MTITTLLWLAALVQPRVEGIGINLLSSFIEGKLPKLKYINHLRRVLDKSISDFKATVTQATIPTGTYPFYDSEAFYTKCLDFRLYNQSNNLDIKGIHQAISQNDKIAPCTQEDIQKFLDCFLANANEDKDLKAYFIEENYQEEIFNIRKALEELSVQVQVANSNKSDSVLPTTVINDANSTINGNSNINLQNIYNTGTLTIFLDSRIEQVREQEERLQAYKAKMAKDYEKNILGEENIALKDIYIEPYYGVNTLCYTNDLIHSLKEFQTTDSSLHTFIESWINRFALPPHIDSKYADKRVLLLLGQPGQGKSSFCSRLMYDAFHQQNFTSAPIFRINLRYVSDTEGLFRNPMDTLFKHLSGLPHNLKLDEDLFKNSILLLDGLDELIIQKDMNQLYEEDFLLKVIKDTKAHYENIRVIVTSRYQVDLYRFTKDCLVLNLSPLSIEQQQGWLEEYRKLKPIELDKDTLTSFQAIPHIAELSEQAILLYLIANVHRLDNPLDASANRSVLYKKLFDSLIQRKWQDNEQIQALEGIKEDALRLLLQQVAFTIFQSDKEYVNNTQIKDLLKKSSNKTLSNFSLNEDSTRGLMLAFYMQKTSDNSEGNEEASIEFLHKSLQEYLAAEYIWEQIKTIASSKPNIEFTFRTLRDCFNDKFITPNITDLLIEIIENNNEAIRTNISKRLREFFPVLLEYEFLYPSNRQKNGKPMQACLNTFYGYWTILSHLEDTCDYIIEDIKQPFCNLLIALRNYQVYCRLDMVGIDLSHSNLEGADLSFVNFEGANLCNSNLLRVNLMASNLSMTDLSYANMTNAIITNADLTDAMLNKAKLNLSNLSGSNFSYSNLSESSIVSSNLFATNLSHCNMHNADLTCSILMGANFDETIIIYQQLIVAGSLRACLNLDPSIKKLLDEHYPYLFERNPLPSN